MREADVPFVPELIQLDPSERLVERVSRAAEPILRFRLLLDRPRWVKAQLCGPTTLAAFGGVSPDEAIDRVRRVALESVLLLARDGHQVIFFLDEPALVREEPRGVSEVLEALRSAGAATGVHCCGNTDWARVLGWPLDFVSFDVRASLDALVDDRAAFERYVADGGSLALGLVPTTQNPPWVLTELVDAVEVTLRAVLPGADPARELVARSLLTPACGLGMKPVEEARQIAAALAQAQALLRGRFELSAG